MLALVVMNWRDPAFLTFDSQQALDVRVLELLRDRLTPELLSEYAASLVLRRGLEQASRRRIVRERNLGEEFEIEEFFKTLGD